MLARLFVVVVFILSTAASATSAAEARQRRDLLDLDRFLRFVLQLHPTIEPNARLRSWLGYVDDRKFSPHVIDLTLFHEANPGLAPERIVFGGAARFDRAGFLDFYSGSTPAGDERFAALQKRLGTATIDAETIRSALEALGAPFARRAPDLKTCRSLVVAFAAIGKVTEVTEAAIDALPPEKIAVDLTRRAIAWRIDVVARRPRGVQRLWILIDPWGDLVTVAPLDSPHR